MRTWSCANPTSRRRETSYRVHELHIKWREEKLHRHRVGMSHGCLEYPQDGYLERYAFTVITDHQSLRWLQRLEELRLEGGPSRLIDV